MKRLLILTLFIGGPLLLFGQTKSPLYMVGEIGVGNQVVGDIAVHFGLKNGINFKLGYSVGMRQNTDRPDDYGIALSDVPLTWIGFEGPYTYLNTYQIGIGKIFPLNQKNSLYLNLLTGGGYSTFKEINKWEKRDIDFDDFQGNYNWSYGNEHMASLIINPKLEYLPAHYNGNIGFSASPSVMINESGTYISMAVGIIVALKRLK